MKNCIPVTHGPKQCKGISFQVAGQPSENDMTHHNPWWKNLEKCNLADHVSPQKVIFRFVFPSFTQKLGEMWQIGNSMKIIIKTRFPHEDDLPLRGFQIVFFVGTFQSQVPLHFCGELMKSFTDVHSCSPNTCHTGSKSHNRLIALHNFTQKHPTVTIQRRTTKHQQNFVTQTTHSLPHKTNQLHRFSNSPR